MKADRWGFDTLWRHCLRFSPHLGEVPRASGRVGLVGAGLLRRTNIFYSILFYGVTACVAAALPSSDWPETSGMKPTWKAVTQTPSAA